MKGVKEAAKRLSECCSFLDNLNCLDKCPYKERVTDGHISWNDCSEKYEKDFRIIVNYILNMEDDGK